MAYVYRLIREFDDNKNVTKIRIAKMAFYDIPEIPRTRRYGHDTMIVNHSDGTQSTILAKPGKVWADKVWFENDNDMAATEALLEEYHARLKGLRKLVDRAEQTIELLEGLKRADVLSLREEK